MFDLNSSQMLLQMGGGEGVLANWELASDNEHHGSSFSTLTPASGESALWSGATSLELSLPPGPHGAMEAHRQRDQKKPEPKKTGWCAMRRDIEAEGWELMDFDGLCLRARPDGRRYVVNLRFAGLLGDSRKDDLYQAVLPPVGDAAAGTSRSFPWASGVVPDENGWIAYRIPWGAFQLTWRGYLQQTSPTMNLERFTHVGLLLADGARGEFAIELANLSAFRYHPDEMQETHVQNGMFLNEVGGYTKEFE